MRRKRYQRGSVKPRKRGGKTYWYAQWREDGTPRSKELGLYSSMSRAQAEGILSEMAARLELHRSAVQRALDRLERLALHDDEGIGRRRGGGRRGRAGGPNGRREAPAPLA